MDASLVESFKSLSIAERIQLVEALWDSIALSQENFDMTGPQQNELERRLDALESGHSLLSRWDEVKQRILMR